MTDDPQQSQLAQKLFEGALERHPWQRASYLEDACPDDPELREYVLLMVTSHEEDPDFLETPILVELLSSPVLEDGEIILRRYRIVRLVGMGGMGEVYEALDMSDPGRPERIALKTIRRDLAARPEAVARLHQEIQLVHKITDPNVCKVHHLDKEPRPHVALLFLTMDFLDGETLSRRLQRLGHLSPEDAYHFARDIAAGLDAAHIAKVIHRDLKADNIMLVPKNGTTHAVIMDFGIASSMEDESRPGTGTKAYMAPERIRTAGATPQADIYSFGVVLFEMVTGQLPFAPGPGADERKPPSVSGSVGRWHARTWDRVIRRCLDPVASKRFRSATAAVEGLRPAWWRIPLAACLVVSLLAIPNLNELGRSLMSGPVNAVAILPFEISGASEQQGGLIDYVAEEMQNDRALRRRWLVFSPADMRQMHVQTGEQAKTVFGASHIVTGTMTMEDGSVTVSGQLAGGSDSRILRKFQKVCPLDNAECLQDGMLRELVAVLDPQSSLSTHTDPVSKEALPYYLQGLHYLRRDSTSYDLAITLLQQAIAKDPPGARPRVALSDAYMLGYRDKGDKARLADARKTLNEIALTHPDLPDLHASRGYLLRLEGRYEDAARELQVALRADPSNHLFHRRLGMIQDAAGRDADAIAAFNRAIELQPRHWAGYLDFAVFYHRRGCNQEAVKLLEQLVQWAPDHAQGLAVMGGVYVDMGRNADAQQVSERSCKLSPGRSCYVNLGIALQRQRRTREAINAYNRALSFGNPSAILLLNTADAHAYLQEREKARDFFRLAVVRARKQLEVNLRDSGIRALLAYCLAQLDDRSGALFEIAQALQSAPGDKNVQKYGVLTYERLGMRDKVLEVLTGVTKAVLGELELTWGSEDLRKDPRYSRVAQEVRNKREEHSDGCRISSKN